MRIVIDSNVVQEQALRDFLSKSCKNKAYLMVEALKGDTLAKIFGLMKILCEFPKQVVVLKSLQNISALKGRRSGMTRRMIDKPQTKAYDNWCVGLAKAEPGDADYRRQLMERGKEATAQVDALTAAQSRYAEIIAEEAKSYTQDGILRADEPYTSAMIDKMAERIVTLTTKLSNPIQMELSRRRSGSFHTHTYSGLERALMCRPSLGSEMAAPKTLRRRRSQTISSTPRLWRKQPTFKA